MRVNHVVHACGWTRNEFIDCGPLSEVCRPVSWVYGFSTAGNFCIQIRVRAVEGHARQHIWIPLELQLSAPDVRINVVVNGTIVRDSGDLKTFVIVNENRAVKLHRAIKQRILATDLKGANFFLIKVEANVALERFAHWRVSTAWLVANAVKGVEHAVGRQFIVNTNTSCGFFPGEILRAPCELTSLTWLRDEWDSR